MLTLTLILTLLFLILLIGYTALLYLYHRAFQEMEQPVYVEDRPVMVSVIIPARNEEKNIVACLKSLQNQDYPSDFIEIIVVDDHSTDRTVELAGAFNIRVIKLSDIIVPKTIAFKKLGITKGIEAARGEIILTTDADCVAPKEWIRLLTGPIRNKKAIMSIGGVRMRPEASYLSKFQSLDYAVLQGITAASVSSRMHDMGSGANLAYTRAVFFEVNGFEGVDDIASGDDMLLMQKISAKYANGIQYVSHPDVVVETHTEPDVESFLRQRIRWASKTGRYNNKKLLGILALVYGVNLIALYLIIFSVCSWMNAAITIAAIVCKTLVEWRFTRDVLAYFKLSALLRYFFWSQPLHIFYTVVSGTFGLFGKVTWKERSVK